MPSRRDDGAGQRRRAASAGRPGPPTQPRPAAEQKAAVERQAHRSPRSRTIGMVDGHELGAVRKRAFDLDFVDHRRPRPPSHRRGPATGGPRSISSATAAVADELEQLRGDERHRLRDSSAAGRAPAASARERPAWWSSSLSSSCGVRCIPESGPIDACVRAASRARNHVTSVCADARQKCRTGTSPFPRPGIVTKGLRHEPQHGPQRLAHVGRRNAGDSQHAAFAFDG